MNTITDLRHQVHSIVAAAVLVAVIAAVPVAAQGPPPTLVEVSEVKSMEFNDQITLVGRTEAKVHSRIVAEIAGRVTSIDAPEGNRVKKGQPLVSIDSERIALSLKAKEAETAEAKAQADLAQSNLKRAKELYAQSLIPETTRDSALAWSHIAHSRYERLEAERANLARDLENSTIRAPYTGYTLRQQVDVGEWVNPGTPVYEMVDLSQAKVTVDLPERYYGQLDIGSKVDIAISNDTSRLVVGTVTGVARSASEETHTFPVIIMVDNSEGRLGGGKLVRATLSLHNRFTSLAVSKDAVVRQGTRTSVYTVKDGQAVMIPVQTSSTSGQYVAVMGEGLAEGLPVVVRGNERIFPGSPVKVNGGENAGAGDGQTNLAGTGQTQSSQRD